jgi:hypothetical protein
MTKITQNLRSLCGPSFTTKFPQNFDLKNMISGFFMGKKKCLSSSVSKKKKNKILNRKKNITQILRISSSK